MERIFRIFFDAAAGGAEMLSLLLSNNYRRRQVKSKFNSFRQILSPVVTGNSSTHTISMEASCTIIIKGSER